MQFKEFIEQLKKCFDPIDLERYTGEFGYVVNSEENITRIGYATNLNQIVATKAIVANVDALITHHDVWDFLYEMRTDTLGLLEEKSISHCFVHLPLDAADFGNAVSLCQKMGFEIKDSFAYFEDLPCGRVCECPSPIPLSTIASQLKEVTGDSVKIWTHNTSEVRRVGVATGAGNLTNRIKEAADKGCDTYITGESSLYTVDYARYRGINLLIGTHTHTELPGLESLCDRLKQYTDFEYLRIHEGNFESADSVKS